MSVTKLDFNYSRKFLKFGCCLSSFSDTFGGWVSYLWGQVHSSVSEVMNNSYDNSVSVQGSASAKTVRTYTEKKHYHEGYFHFTGSILPSDRSRHVGMYIVCLLYIFYLSHINFFPAILLYHSCRKGMIFLLTISNLD